MVKRGLILLVCTILLSISVFAQDNRTNVFLPLKDANTNENISNVAVYINLDGTDLDQYVNDAIQLELGDGRYKATIRVDDLSTPGNDYYKKTEFTVKNNLIQTIFLYPVGTVKGIVKDKLDNIVGDAELKFECTPNPEITFPSQTDKFGGFYVNFVPVGKCKIFASYNGGIGFKEIDIVKGTLQDIEINLDKSIISKRSDIFLQIGIALLIIIAVLIAYFRKEVESYIFKKKEKAEIKEEVSKRAKDVIETLNEKEKKIVDYLLEHEHKGVQSSIRHETGIPRTSLARCLKSLQNKKIIEVEKIGKAIKIKLTDWFIGKD
ncbi:hypothetical protein KY331_04540 [Candidatus Woesearchaeota archaeon]|nr:hypothetical protein [Candidatus Woesearchaeota archaeon]